jgi:hypothetical protein
MHVKQISQGRKFGEKLFTIFVSPPKSRVASCWTTHHILEHLCRKGKKEQLVSDQIIINRASDLACENDNSSHGLLSSR